MNTVSDNKQWWRGLLLAPIAVLAVLSIVATGGGGGDGDGGFNGGDNGDDVPPIILSSYNFEIASTDSDIDVPMEVSVGGFAEVAVNFGNTIRGSVELDVSDTGAVELLSTVTDAGSTFGLSASISEPPLSGALAVLVIEAIVADAFDEPTSGTIEITTTPPIGTITVTFLPTMEVEIRLNGIMPSVYSWDELSDLLIAPSVPEHERIAAVAALWYEFLFERVFEVAEVLGDLDEVDLTGEISEQCEMYRAGPPASVESIPGRVALTQPGPQVYQVEWTDCWMDFPFDTLLTGIIQLGPYIEEVDASNNLTRVGFGPDAGTRGGVEFRDFTIAEAFEVDGMFMLDPSSTIVVNGGFSLVFTAP